MNRDSVTVAAIQALPKGYFMNHENVDHAVYLLTEASRRGADMACFPEAYPSLGEEEIREAARNLGIFVIAGFLIKDGPRLYNESILIDSEGRVAERHRKSVAAPGVEPYSCGKEEFRPVETPWGKIGILICIEGWGFPEGFHSLSGEGVDLIFNPNLIFRKKHQMRMSLISRVLDYKIPIVAPNNAFWSLRLFEQDPPAPPEGGQSLILAPPPFQTKQEIIQFTKDAPSCEGWIVAEGGKGEEILMATLDLKAMRRSRSLFNDCFFGRV